MVAPEGVAEHIVHAWDYIIRDVDGTYSAYCGLCDYETQFNVRAEGCPVGGSGQFSLPWRLIRIWKRWLDRRG